MKRSNPLCLVRSTKRMRPGSETFSRNATDRVSSAGRRRVPPRTTAATSRGGAATNMKEEFQVYGLPEWSVQVVGFLKLRNSEGNGIPLTEALDRVIYAKLLPKLRGEDSSQHEQRGDRTGHQERSALQGQLAEPLPAVTQDQDGVGLAFHPVRAVPLTGA